MKSQQSSQTIGGTCGVIFTILYWVGTGLLAGPINQTDNLAAVQKTFAEQADNFDVAAFLLVLSIPFLLVFAHTLWGILRKAGAGAEDTASLVLVGATGGAATTLAGAALTGGAAFLAESTTVDGRTAAFSHSAAEACVFYAMVLYGVVALTTALITFRRGAFPRWFGWVAAVLGTGMVAGSAASPLLRSLALLAGVCTYLFFLIGSFAVWRFADRAPRASGGSE